MVKGSYGVVFVVDMDFLGFKSDLCYLLVSVLDKFSVNMFSGVLIVSKRFNVGIYILMVKV